MQAHRHRAVRSRVGRWLTAVAALCALTGTRAYGQTQEEDAALLAPLTAPAFCAIDAATGAGALESAAALYRAGEFRAAAAQAAGQATASSGIARLRALALWERALKVMACDAAAFDVQREYQREADRQPDATAERCHAIGRLARLTATRNFDEAERRANQTLECLASIPDASDVASEAYTTLAIVAHAQSWTAVADEHARLALQRAASPLMRSEALRVQGNIVLSRDDDPAAAAQVFERSALAAQQTSDRESQAVALIYWGDALARAGLHERAAGVLELGLQLARAGEMRRVLALARYQQGARAYRTRTGAALAQAVTQLRASAALYEAIGDQTQESAVRLELGSALRETGDYQRARAAVERSRELSIESGSAHEAAKADHTLGLFALTAQPPDYDAALRHLEAALAGLRRSGEDAGDEARLLNDLAIAQLGAGHVETATRQLLEAARLAQRLRDPAWSAGIDATLGWAYWRDGLAEPAHAAWRAALRSDQPATRVTAWWGLAQSIAAAAPNAALSRYARAIEEVERLRPPVGAIDDETRTNFGRRFSELYREYAALLLRLGRPAQAHWVTMLTQQQELIEAQWAGTRADDGAARDLPGRPDPDGPAACDAALVTRERDALDRWSRWQSERTPAREACCRDDSDLPVADGACASEASLVAYCPLRRAVRREQRALLRLQDDCVDAIEAAARRREGGNEFALPRSFREAWDKANGEGVYLVVTIVEDERLHVLLRRPGSDSYMTRSVAVTRAQLRNKTDVLSRAMAEAAALKNRPAGPARDAALAVNARGLQTGVLRELYDLVLGGFDDAALSPVSAGRPAVITFVLDRVLREVPMAALYDGKRYLGERFAVSMVTPTTVSAPASTAPARASLVMGVSKPDLPHVEGEVAEVARLLNASPYLNENSTRRRLLAWLDGLTAEAPALALHIASHAVMGGSKASSHVRLWDHDDLTGIDLDELRRSLRHVQLVVLSACQSAGQGDSDLALGLAGLAEKGARSVLGSLWNVDDASTERLMVAFYTAWRHDPAGGVAQALALAQRELLRDFAHPYFWASFEVIGRWN